MSARVYVWPRRPAYFCSSVKRLQVETMNQQTAGYRSAERRSSLVTWSDPLVKLQSLFSFCFMLDGHAG